MMEIMLGGNYKEAYIYGIKDEFALMTKKFIW